MTEEERTTVPIENERGEVKNYETVASRVLRFRKDNPTWFIHTEILSADDDFVCMCCKVGYLTESGIQYVVGMGHAEEWRSDGKINQTNAVENCETSALGRALAASGYGSTDSYASADEIASAKKKAKTLDAVAPGALIFFQKAAKLGIKSLEAAWKGAEQVDRIACESYLAGLKRQAAKADKETSHETDSGSTDDSAGDAGGESRNRSSRART